MEKYVKVGNSGWDCDFGAHILNIGICDCCKNCILEKDNLKCNKEKSQEEFEDYRNHGKLGCEYFEPDKEDPWYPLVIEKIKKHTK